MSGDTNRASRWRLPSEWRPDHHVFAFHEDSNSNAVLITREGQVYAVAEERLTRKRFQAGFPTRSLAWIEKASGVRLGEASILVFGNRTHFLPRIFGARFPSFEHDLFGPAHKLMLSFHHLCYLSPAFSGLMGEQVAAKGVTIVDDGTIDGRRGSLTIDDEGTPTERTVLIEDGVLKGYMQDRMNARLMGLDPTGNGRRESYAHKPIPRMTNTYMLAGDKDPAEILASVKKGLYAVNFGGGQVDITSGKFVFSCTEAYLVENGKIGAPVKGATLIGNGPESMKKVTMIGNDLQLDTGIGTCGKDGQGVPVGIGQPTLSMEDMTVGGTQAG